MHSILNDSAKGAMLGVVAFILVSSAFPLPAVAQTSTGPLFSMTLLAPTSNPIRRQWAAIVTNSLDSVNIGASLVFVSFDVLLADLFGCPSGCPPPTYAKGGWDAGFIGDSSSPLPDYGTQNAVLYRDTGAGDLPPIGSDYYFFDNATYNSDALAYNAQFNTAARIPILQQMVSIIMQQRPAMILFYEEAVYVWSPTLKSWGSDNIIDTAMANQDYSHWVSTNGGTTLNIGETGDIGGVNILQTSAQNSYYSSYLFYPIQAYGEPFNPATFSYYDGTVAGVSASADHLTWTVREVPHLFSDGVSVTSNDYIYSWMAQMINDVGYVGEGTAQSLLGLDTQFTFLNGTTDYVVNGTYYHGAAPSGFTATGTFTALNSTSWKFTLPSVYLFTDPVITGGSPVPMHLYDNYAFNTWATGVLSGFTGASGGLSTSTFTYHYKTSIYGGSGGDSSLKVGNGTGVSYGPIDDGAYIYHGYDPVALVGTLVRNPLYWNASALQAVGYDKIQTVHVVYINNKDAAEAALTNGQVNFLDSNYAFNSQDVASLKSQGFTVLEDVDPSTGWQEMGLNMGNPVFGTGTATPLGSSNPAEAAFAARMVRQAISYLIPRDYIISQLFGGLGRAGMTQINPAFTYAYPAGSAPDPYDPTMAKSFLAAAGYSTGVSPPSVSVNTGSSPTISGVTVPGFLLGNTFTLTGTFPVSPVVGAQSGGFAITLQQSVNNGANWTSVALGSTNAGGLFSMSYAPTTAGAQEYRVFLTGLPENTVMADGINNPAQAEALVPPLATLKPLNATDTQYTPPTSITVGSLGTLLTQLTSSINAGFSSLTNSTNAKISGLTTTVNGLSSNVNSLSGQVSTLNSNLTTTTDIAYVAIAVAIILGITAIVLARRKPAAK